MNVDFRLTRPAGLALRAACGSLSRSARLLIFDLEERSWSLMRRAFFHRGDAGVEVVEAFDGLVQGHGDRQAIGGEGGKENRVAATPLCLVLGAWFFVGRVLNRGC